MVKCQIKSKKERLDWIWCGDISLELAGINMESWAEKCEAELLREKKNLFALLSPKEAIMKQTGQLKKEEQIVNRERWCVFSRERTKANSLYRCCWSCSVGAACTEMCVCWSTQCTCVGETEREKERESPLLFLGQLYWWHFGPCELRAVYAKISSLI